MKSIAFLFSLILFVSVSCTQQKAKEAAEPAQSVEIVYHVEGMTCDHCEMSIQKGVGELKGITTVEANHEDSTTRVVFSPSETNEKEIIAAIEKRGYTVVKN